MRSSGKREIIASAKALEKLKSKMQVSIKRDKKLMAQEELQLARIIRMDRLLLKFSLRILTTRFRLKHQRST
jgi:hypothetical protein